MRFLAHALLVTLVLTGCAGTGPKQPLEEYLAAHQLPDDAPVIVIDLDDTIFRRDASRPMRGAPAALLDLARDHLIVYLTARPTHAKVPGVTHNRRDSEKFLRKHGFPDGPLFTSSLREWITHGEGGGKRLSFQRLREYGVSRVALAVGDRPHDLDVYLHNGHVEVVRAVIILIEESEVDPDREELPPEVLEHVLPGSGDAWPRLLAAYREGTLPSGGTRVIAQGVPPGS